ncbi:multicopper oxidase domain-containing protein [Ramlibacter sp. AN1015]|uniref:multicopper oxidase family protein n=1 Tax=Ramlibacter sp. AN1015 TaxID=3133428 RepID=UPI0030BF446C
MDVHIELRAARDQVAVRPGRPTEVWRYHGKLLKGEAGCLQPSDSYLGPVIRLRRGQRVRIELINELPEPTIIHWHGLHVPDDMDGHPRHAIGPGQRYVYAFHVLNRAGTYWYHAHPHGRTGHQVYHGLAGLLLVSDEEEAALRLPRGDQDMPLVIQDRTFDDDNQLVYPAAGNGMGTGMMSRRGGGRGMGSMMASMMGVLGDRILVNGRQVQALDVDRRACRLRLLNGSNTRTYKLAWNDGSPLTVIGTDGGLLAAPAHRKFVVLGPAERADIWTDFASWKEGESPSLQSLPFEGGMTMGGGPLPDGSQFPVLQFRIVGSGPVESARLPDRLAELPPVQASVAINAEHPKVFDLTMGMMVWGINGRPFEMLQATAQETVKLGTHEVWEFRNEGRNSMMGMVMAHSMHIHGLQFRVIGREIADRFAAAYRTVQPGLMDEGWKDTVLVMPGERVRVLVGFEDYPGLFLYHCHMLEHEDSGLMRNYLVKA